MMKAHVYVTLKPSVLDPQGQTIHNALRKMGTAGVESVRQGKYFAITLRDGMAADAAREQVAVDDTVDFVGAGGGLVDALGE